MKNNIIFKRIVCVLLIVMLLILGTKAYAADSFKTTLSVDNSSRKRGSEVTVTIGLSDISIQSGEKGIGAYTAKLEFDSSVFEYVSAAGTDKWETPLYQSGLITGLTVDGEVTSETQNIASIKFKVKSDAKLGQTTIKLVNFSGSTAETDVAAQDTSVNVTITDENGNNPNNNNNNNNNNNKNPNNGNNQNDPNDPNNPNGENGENGDQNGENGNGSGNGNGSNQNNGSNNNSNKGKTVLDNIKDGLLPKTGAPRIITFIVIALAAIIIARLIIMRILLNRKRPNINAKPKRKNVKSRGRRAK